MITYIAGPMTGIPEWNFPLFFATAERLRGDGHIPINPATNCGPTIAEALSNAGTSTWEEYLRMDLRHLSEAQAVCVLPEWHRSRGASLEVHIARALAMPIVRYGPHGLEPVAVGGGPLAGQLEIGVPS